MHFKCSIGVRPAPVSAPFQYNSVIDTLQLVGVKLLIELLLSWYTK